MTAKYYSQSYNFISNIYQSLNILSNSICIADVPTWSHDPKVENAYAL